ncbi:hypothetical protein P175DRAFT_0488288 [Aspergillus ochraceoroseus IBT 24754]|uniref:SWIM-type domain-containing protein n=1 Tax=Aspergillus ochraceoroseus IBT 24754 TaxID=1392256 RepID=A0A2T5LKZ4_9EURO|nr:uncharacterized protein P175DRAFT_0488288 [Aspergillus ochraceoroseus IBT 24754]PTU16949.1 hypothetical protein P175DRAFT_0488288 [Aspergillus ochraceoroseus IBT 24754]
MQTTSEERDSTGPRTVVHGKSGISYDLSQLDASAEARALVGLTTRFEVLSCSVSRTGYEFVFSEGPRVHLDSDSYTCTCSTFQSRSDVACPHIFWLLDQLHGQFISLPLPLPSGFLLSSDGHPCTLTRIERLLAGQLETVAVQLNWPYVRSEFEGGMSRAQKVRDIMSAFSTSILPEEFRPDLIDDDDDDDRSSSSTGHPHHPPRTPEQCVVQGDFEATMFRLAVHDVNVFASLCKAMPAGACAAIYFDKVQQQSRKLLLDFDRSCHPAAAPSPPPPPPPPTPRKIEAMTSALATQLQENVARIQRNLALRAPHGMEGAAKALVTLLEEICRRNKDALDGGSTRWGRASFPGEREEEEEEEDEDQRNLYQQLVGKTTHDDEECFVLDALEHLAGSDLHQFREKLRALLHKNEVNRAPRAYILKLAALVRAAESASSMSILGQKRPATATCSRGGDTKRTR